MFKNYIIFWGVGHQKITLDYREEGGRSRESKKGLRNFLMVPNGYIGFKDFNGYLSFKSLMAMIADIEKAD